MEDDETIVIERVFDAPVESVWNAWTNPEMVKQWWGPTGFTAPHVNIDFRVGGKSLYCMRGALALGEPEQDLWSGGEFKEIVPMQKITTTDYFADEKGNKVSPIDYGMDPDFPEESTVTFNFADEDGKTKLQIIYRLPASPTAKEAMLNSGMQEGWDQSLDKLAKVLM